MVAFSTALESRADLEALRRDVEEFASEFAQELTLIRICKASLLHLKTIRH